MKYFIVCLVALLAGSASLQAQEVEPVVVDTIVAPPVIDGTEEVQESIEDVPADITYYKKKKLIPDTPSLRQVPDTLIERLKKQKEFAYANDSDYLVKEPEPQPEEEPSNSKGFWYYFYSFFSNDGVRIFCYIALIGFFVFIIYKVVVVNKLFLVRSNKKAKGHDDEGDGDITDDNLDEKIKKAISAREHRAAVRFMYLKTLQLLNDRQWIRYHADATNYEYVNQMSSRKLGNEFSFLTRVYDYVWYGEFTLTEEQFEVVHKNFTHFYNAANS